MPAGSASTGHQRRSSDSSLIAIRAPAGARIAISDESEDLPWWPVDALPAGTDHALAYLVAQATLA
ncbi:hypothetical protein MAHJHV50_49300 [Mycobacterium avium subsp. hominissuis]